MILKASQRGGGQGLAVHLMRTDDNEHVEVHELRGFVSDDLSSAFKEAQAISRGTKCRQYLFSLSLNPPDNENVSIAVFEKAIERIEQKLGLESQPRAIVFHEKEGRRHAHCVWSRIDAGRMSARQLSHFKMKLRDISRDLYLEHEWKMPRGLMNSDFRDPVNFTLAEWQQAKRAGHDPRELKQTLQECWAASDGKASFEHALKERGFHLARGDRRGFVVLDYQGEVYSLSRALGLKAKEVRARLGSESDLRSAAQTKRIIAERTTPAIKAHIDEARLSFKHKTASLDHNKALMVQRHRNARQELRRDHRRRHEQEIRARTARLPKGLKAVWSRITGKYRVLKKQNMVEAAHCQRRDRNEHETLVTKQLSERRKLQNIIKAQRGDQAQLLRSLRRDVGAYLTLGRVPEPPEREQTRRRTRSLKR
jgi:relaxase-like protein